MVVGVNVSVWPACSLDVSRDVSLESLAAIVF
jgi:hypothetical protein